MHDTRYSVWWWCYGMIVIIMFNILYDYAECCVLSAYRTVVY